MFNNREDHQTQATGLVNPVNYYSVNDIQDPVAVRRTAIRQEEHLLWEEIMPAEDVDHSIAVASLSISTGESRARVSKTILAFYQLGELPLLNSLQHELFHLDLPRLFAISGGLFGLNPENLDAVDEILTDYLTAKAPNQTLPSADAIRRKIKSIRDALEDPRATGEIGTQDLASFEVRISPEGMADLNATFDAVDGQLIQQAVDKQAKATGKTPTEAFLDIMRGNIKAKVVLNLYTAKDLANAPVWAAGVGWIDAKSGDYWTAQNPKQQDMDVAAKKHVGAHDPPPDMEAAVKGRDGICRFPGCNVKAIHCDCDHRVNHADGGSTCIHGLLSLCRHHHNAKTDGRATYFMDPITGIVIWLLEDGTWAVTTPEGPLTPENARWAQTVSQYRARHHERWAKAAAAEAKATTRPADTHQVVGQEAHIDDAPPF